MRKNGGYDAFGSLLPGRNYSSTSDTYRFGFNGQEKVDEINGSAGTHNTAQFWEYDTRTARRWNLDPKPNASISQYAAFALNPIFYRDVLGDTIVINLFGKDDGPEFHAVANNAVHNQVNDGVFLVFGHGFAGGVEYTNQSGEFKFAFNGPDFNAVIASRSPEYDQAIKDGNQIVLHLHTCGAARDQTNASGAKIPNIAEDISSSLPKGSTLIAPDGYCMYGTEGGKPAVVGVSAIGGGWDPTGRSGYETLVDGVTISQQPKSWDRGTSGNSIRPTTEKQEPSKPKKHVKK